jgi:hypothetical protein
MKNRVLLRDAKSVGTWEDPGALKRVLEDDLIRERNRFAREVMADIEEQRAESD